MLPYRTRFMFGSCWPALVGFLIAFALLFIGMYGSGYFGSPKYDHEPGEWKVIMFPIMAGLLAGAGVLVVNGVLFVLVKPAAKRMAFFIGMLALPVGIVAGIGIMCLL